MYSKANISPSDITNIVFYEKPFLKFERLIETYFAFAPRGFKSFASFLPIWIKEKLFQKFLIIKKLEQYISDSTNWDKKLLFCEHHLSHAASAYYPSPFNMLNINSRRCENNNSICQANKNSIKIIKEMNLLTL